MLKKSSSLLLPLQGTESNKLGKVFDLVGKLLCYKMDTHSRINRMSWLCAWRWREILARTLLTCFCFLRPYGHASSCSEKLNNLAKMINLIASRSRPGSQFYSVILELQRISLPRSLSTSLISPWFPPFVLLSLSLPPSFLFWLNLVL